MFFASVSVLFRSIPLFFSLLSLYIFLDFVRICSDEDDAASYESTHTLTNETFNGSNDACETGNNVTTTPSKHNQRRKQPNTTNCENSNEALSQHLSTSPSTSCGSGEIDSKEEEEEEENDDEQQRQNAAKNSNGLYKRRESNNSNSISLPPLDTPMPTRRNAFGRKRNVDAKRNNHFSNDKGKQTTNRRRLTTPTATTTPTTISNDGSKIKKATNDNCNGSNKSSSASDGLDDVPTETKSVNGNGDGRKKQRNRLNSVMSHSKLTGEDSDSLASVNKCSDSINLTGGHAMRKLSVSNASLMRNVNT